MKFDINTLAFIESLIFVTQVIVLLLQYRVNRTYQGVGWAVLGSVSMATGVIFMPLVNVKSLLLLAMIANPLVVLGQIFLYIGITRFLDKKENKLTLMLIFFVSIFAYYYFIFVINSISPRTIIISATLATLSIMTAYRLFFHKNRLVSVSTNFTAAVFLIYGVFQIVRAFYTLLMPPMQNYSDQYTFLAFGFIFPVVISTLWTFGFIIMLNHHLNIENKLEKEKMQLIFNTSPDAVLITRLSDGFIIDVNQGFSVMTGYSHQEAIGNYTLKTKFWDNPEERKAFLDELDKKGTCENIEFIFRRKDGSKFIGIMSAKIIIIFDVPHIIISVHDVTKRKLAEQKIQDLVNQLEIERNIAQKNSITDSLTGLANRRYLDETLTTEFHRIKRIGGSISLLMLDIDYFKKYNDTYGHLAGDECLRQIGNLFNNIIGRVTDTVARYGGEEFVVILPETKEDGAKVVANKMRRAVEELAIPHSASDISRYVTVSIGVVTVYDIGSVGPEQLLTKVDEALYRAKESGRNRIEFAEPKLNSLT